MMPCPYKNVDHEHCRQIINAHGGQIDVNSSIGSGTTFWFTLPIFDKK